MRPPINNAFIGPAPEAHRALAHIGRIISRGRQRIPAKNIRARVDLASEFGLPILGEQAIILTLDGRIALAYVCFQLGAIEHRNVAAAVMDQPRLFQLSSGLRDAFAAHAQHIGDQ